MCACATRSCCSTSAVGEPVAPRWLAPGVLCCKTAASRCTHICCHVHIEVFTLQCPLCSRPAIKGPGQKMFLHGVPSGMNNILLGRWVLMRSPMCSSDRCSYNRGHSINPSVVSCNEEHIGFLSSMPALYTSLTPVRAQPHGFPRATTGSYPLRPPPVLTPLLLLLLAASCASCACSCCLSAFAADRSRCNRPNCACS